MHRADAPDVFDDELRSCLERLRKSPMRGSVYPSSFEIVVRRVLVRKTRKHLYYAVQGSALVVLSVWGAPRRAGPKL